MTVVLLKTGEEERLVPAKRSAKRRPKHVLAEDGLRDSIQLVHIGHRFEFLGFVAPEERPRVAGLSQAW
jgi:hypothetical protein